MLMLSRRSVFAGLSVLPLAGARAQERFPDRPLRFVVGFPPGGPNDLLRIVAPGIGERLKRPVVVENRAGANGEIAAASVAKAVPDGGVFMLASNGSTTVAPALNRNLPFDVRIDFAAVAPVGINPMLLVVRNDLPANDVAELLALARARPGKLNGASAGAGGATHLALELFKSMGQVDIVHVPYKGGGPAMADLMASLVDVYFGGLSTALPHVRSGKLRALGQTGEKRSAAAPDIPTIAEQGYPGLTGASWFGLFAPARMDAKLADETAAKVADALGDPALVSSLQS
jgi:tripartite-type tricarboxylate transporter receptor subunit TctC